MDSVNGEVTREKVEELAQAWAHDPTTVVEVKDAMSTLVEFWADQRHKARELPLGDVSSWHRAAIRALEAGLVSVGDLPMDAREGVTDIERADYLLVHLRARVSEPTAAAALRVLAHDDDLCDVPGESHRVHPCPVCQRPATGRAVGREGLCFDCRERVVCVHGRRVRGFNTSFGGGFKAEHLDDGSSCGKENTPLRCWVDGVECEMGEYKFGGVYVVSGPGC